MAETAQVVETAESAAQRAEAPPATLREYVESLLVTVILALFGTTFVVQEHHARRLHYDLRLERLGVLKSWAVPKGIPENHAEKRLAVETEDHPLAYGGFEGTIPQGEYGAGTVKIWDKGSYKLLVWNDDMIEFILNGGRLVGRYVLARFKKAGQKQWILIKARD